MVRTRTVICPCGNDTYEGTLGDALQPVWRCANCNTETPRKRVRRRTNTLRAIRAYLALAEAWKPLNEALEALVAEGKAQGGAFLVHGSAFNWHLKQLTDKAKPSNWEITYHTAEAKRDMVKAQAFIDEKRGVLTRVRWV